MESLNLTLLTLFLGAVIGTLILLFQKVNFWAGKKIPYLKFTLPIFGNTDILLFRRLTLFDALTSYYNSFPDARYFGVMIFHTPIVIIRDPELIKETCVKNFDNFVDRRSFIDEEMDPLYGKNVFSLKGQQWKEMRHTLTPSFTGTKMKFMFELIEKCARDFVQYFLDHPEETNSIETKDAFTRYGTDVIATAAFGISVNSLQNKENEFYVRGKYALNFGSFKRLLKFLLFRLCPRVMRFFGVTFLSRASDRFFRKLIWETVKTREEQKIMRPDMIHLLMEARNKNHGENFSIDDIVAQAFIFILAGFDGTSTSICFIAHELAVNPEIQEKLRNEVDSLTEKAGGEISYETLSEMKYLDMVISEALRKYPSTPLIERLCVKECTLPRPTEDSDEFTAEPGIGVWIPTVALHNDPKYFPNPEKFDPERFSDENKMKIHPYSYLPFGLGPRKCIGDRFALMEIKILIVHILRNFVLERAEKTKNPLEFERSASVTIKNGSWVKFSKREL